MATKDDYAKLNKRLDKAGAPRMYFTLPPAGLNPRRRASRERHGRSAARALRLRFQQGAFSRRELTRRLAQAWASV